MKGKSRSWLLVLVIAAGVACGPLSFLGSDATPALTPTISVPPSGAFQLSAESQDTVIKLTWPAVTGARGYLVYRDGSSVPLNGDKPVTTTTFEDIGLTNGRTYTFTVSAVDSAGTTLARSGETRASPKAK